MCAEEKIATLEDNLEFWASRAAIAGYICSLCNWWRCGFIPDLENPFAFLAGVWVLGQGHDESLGEQSGEGFLRSGGGVWRSRSVIVLSHRNTWAVYVHGLRTQEADWLRILQREHGLGHAMRTTLHSRLRLYLQEIFEAHSFQWAWCEKLNFLI